MNSYRLGSLLILLAAVAAALLPQTCPAQAPDAPGKVAVLDNSSYWRVLYSWNAPLAKTDEGFTEIRPKPGRNVCKCDAAFNYLTVLPPAEWAGLDFDDSAWLRRPWFAKWTNGESDDRAGGGMGTPNLRQLSLRGKFAVDDPAKVKGLALAMAYRGGVIVYLNGKEIARQHLPAGKIEPGAAAELYDKKVYLREDGKPQLWYPSNDEAAVAFPLRARRLEKLAIPADALRKGVNVLAVEIHAAAYPAEYLKTGVPWGSCGLIELHLAADAADGLTPNVVRPKGVQAWNTSPLEQLYDTEYGDPNEPLRQMALAGPKNAWATGRVVVGSDQPIKAIAAKLTDLAGPGGKSIPASAVQVTWGKFDGFRPARFGGSLNYNIIAYGQMDVLRDDALLESPPAEAPLVAHKLDEQARAADGLPPYVPGALQPVTLLARIPKDAAAGEYKGTLTITAGDAKPIEVLVQLKVVDWALPDPANFESFLGLIQSPEGVALAYDVPLFSDKHLELMGKSLELVGRSGGKVLYLPLGAESQYGNDESMVLWVKGDDGKFTYDFSRVEKYIDLALKKMGKPQFVVLGVWDSCMHVSVPTELKRSFARYSILDRATGKVANADGPKNGTPECLEFWKPVLTGVKAILDKQKLSDRTLLGYCADLLPDLDTVEMFHTILPDAGWQSTRHGPTGCEYLKGKTGDVPVKYHGNVWGGWEHHDPSCQRQYGWQHPLKPSYRTWLDRDLFDSSTTTWYRTALEQAIQADRHGLGQIGADFWPGKGKDGKPTGPLVGRFPSTNEGNLAVYAGQLLCPGPDGPALSMRYQMMLENQQECEARIYLEKLLTAKPCPLPEDMAKKCQAVVDERQRWHRTRGLSGEANLYWSGSGYEKRSVALFEAAAEAAKVATGKALSN